MTPVNSSNIRAIGWKPQWGLRVYFHSGQSYIYPDAPESIYHALLAAESVGKAFHILVKQHADQYPATKVVREEKRMTCIKTGCHIYLTEYDAYAYGDAHLFNGVYVFRLVGGMSRSPLAETLHFTVMESMEWFERDRTDGNSTLVALWVSDHGYEGKPITTDKEEN